MSKPNNPPAFPKLVEICESEYPGVQEVNSTDGMTLRDYFAAKAMQAFLSRPNWMSDEKSTASFSYSQADAMLEERAK